MFESSNYTSYGSHESDPAPASGRHCTVIRAAAAKLPTEFGEFRIIGFRSIVSDEEFIVLTRGKMDATRPTLVRIHSQCLTGDVFGSTKCDCGQQLKAAMRVIADDGQGVVIYQQQEGRGIGIINKIRAYALQDKGADTIQANERLGLAVDSRRYDQCGEILSELELKRVRLISNNPEKIGALSRFGLEVVERVSLPVPVHHESVRYLKTKRERMGHMINLPEEIYA